MVVAGEPSGDGFFEVFANLRKIANIFYKTVRILKERRPDKLVLVDYPDFNMRLGVKAKSMGIPVYYFISPQIWAWRNWRIRKIAQFVDKMIVILPFEVEIYERAGVPVYFVGHPLLDAVGEVKEKKEVLRLLGLSDVHPIVLLMPGSRKSEIKRNFPPMLDAARRLIGNFPSAQFVVPTVPTVDRNVYRKIVERITTPIFFVSNKDFLPLMVADVAVVASGTSTLETAFFGIPSVIIYKMLPLTYWLGRLLVDVQHIGMINIIAGERIVPELLQKSATGEAIYTELFRVLSSSEEQNSRKKRLEDAISQLGKPGASKKAAELILF
jgi:lipid-A-disaccharide synthase